MSLEFVEKEYNKLVAQNKKFGKWEHKAVALLNNGRLISLMIFTTAKGTPLDWDTLLIAEPIQTFTLDGNVENFEHCLNQAISVKAIKSFERGNLGYKITLKDNTKLKFLKLTDMLPELNDCTKQRLQSLERIGHCHRDSVDLSLSLAIQNKIVSAYCTHLSKKILFTHSWVEVEYGGDEWVFDFTRNLAINKEGYYRLCNPKNMVKIDNSTLDEDLKLMEKTSFRYKDMRMYLFCPNEVRQLMQEELTNTKHYEQGESPLILVEK